MKLHLSDVAPRENGGAVTSKCGIFVWPHELAADEGGKTDTMGATCTPCVSAAMADLAEAIVASV
jgi:hypothetical protein